MGFTSSNPSMADVHGRSTWVMVSPTFTSLEVLMPEMIYPTLPAESDLRESMSRRNMPISSA